MRKERILVSILIMMIIFALCSISVFADNTSNNVVTVIQTNSTSNTDNSSNSANSTNATAIAENSSNVNNTSTYNNTSLTNTSSNNTSSSLPYTGTSGHAIVFIIIAIVISAIYAYKKVSEYNDI